MLHYHSKPQSTFTGLFISLAFDDSVILNVHAKSLLHIHIVCVHILHQCDDMNKISAVQADKHTNNL